MVPSLSQPLAEMARSYLGVEAMLVGPGTRTGIEIHYDPPRDVGADRIATAVGVFHRYGGPAIMVSFGTATVFDAIDDQGSYKDKPWTEEQKNYAAMVTRLDTDVGRLLALLK